MHAGGPIEAARLPWCSVAVLVLGFAAAAVAAAVAQVSGQHKTAFRAPVEGCGCHTCRTHRWAREPAGPLHACEITCITCSALPPALPPTAWLACRHHCSLPSFSPPILSCPAVFPRCTCCSLAYLHHLIKANEPLAASLLAIHNLHHMNQMTAELRQKIMDDEI